MKVIVIGAGASGLMAAHDLSRNGIEVVVLEAQNRIGGRIHTLIPPGFSNHIEAGAEFIHGKLPLTLQLVKQAKLQVAKTSGKMFAYENGRLSQRFGQGEAWADFYALLENYGNDCTMQDFLETHFAAKKYETLRKQVRDMAQGLDLADASELSVQSIRQEWLSDETQYRLTCGYTPLLEFIHNNSDLKKYSLHLNSCVTRIEWENQKVKIFTKTDSFTANAVVVATSLGNLQQSKIAFVPPITEMENQFSKIGFGSVIKIALEFENRFWEESHEDLGFLFTETGMTFWTQLSIKSPILTGWIGQNYTEKYDAMSDDEIVQIALDELNRIFKDSDVTQIFKSGKVFRYTSNSDSGGGYSWLKLESQNAIQEINKGIADKIWFAGEAFHPGAEVGTVEAALQSGRYVARKISKKR